MYWSPPLLPHNLFWLVGSPTYKIVPAPLIPIYLYIYTYIYIYIYIYMCSWYAHTCAAHIVRFISIPPITSITCSNLMRLYEVLVISTRVTRASLTSVLRPIVAGQCRPRVQVDIVQVDIVQVDIVQVDIVQVDIVQVDIVQVDIVQVDIVQVDIVQVDIVQVDIVQVDTLLMHRLDRRYTACPLVMSLHMSSLQQHTRVMRLDVTRAVHACLLI